MSPWNLLWIVPLSACIVAFLMAIVKVGDCDPDWYDDYYDHDVSGLIEED